MTTTPSTGKHASVSGKEEGELTASASASEDEVQPSTRAPVSDFSARQAGNVGFSASPLKPVSASIDTRDPEQIVEHNSNKLLDLRQQTALRESEMKLKAAQPKKDDAISSKISPARRSSMVSDDAAGEVSAPAEKEKDEASASGSKDLERFSAGITANASCKHLGGSSDEINLPVISQHTVEGNTSSKVLQKSASKGNHYEGVRRGQPDFPVHGSSRELETMKTVDTGVSSDQLLKTVDGSHQPSLNNSGLCNIPGNTTISGPSQLPLAVVPLRVVLPDNKGRTRTIGLEHTVEGNTSSKVLQKSAVSEEQPSGPEVNFTIKSFRIPEMNFEVPETATVGSLKTRVMEAVSALIDQGIRIGVLFQGKDVGDDDSTLSQMIGLSSRENLALDITLEPDSTGLNKKRKHSHGKPRAPFTVAESEDLIKGVEEGLWLPDRWKNMLRSASLKENARRGPKLSQQLLDRVVEAHAILKSSVSDQKNEEELLWLDDGVEFTGIESET